MRRNLHQDEAGATSFDKGEQLFKPVVPPQTLRRNPSRDASRFCCLFLGGTVASGVTYADSEKRGEGDPGELPLL
jgi:hypothetical protein